MKKSWYFLILVIVLTVGFTIMHYTTDFAYIIHTMVILVGATYISRQLVNLQHIAITLLMLTIIEYFVVQYIFDLKNLGFEPFMINALVFTTHFAVDFTALLFFKYRVRLSLRFMRYTNPENWRSIYMTHADPILYGIFFAFILVDLAAFAENLIRNMELFFPISVDVAKPFWSWSWVYKNYEILKSILMSCVITTLLATIFVERQRPDTPDQELEKDTVEH